MATNFALHAPHELAARQTRLSFEHRFFLTVAIVFPLINIIGFAPTYYFKPVLNTPPLPSLLVHIHGAAMSLWIILFSVQAVLISAKKVRLHMTLGMTSIALATVMVIVGVLTAIEAAGRGSAPPGQDPLQFLIVPLADMVTFPILFGAAIYFRRKPAEHKRLMLATAINFLPPSIARIPLAFIPQLGALWFVGVPVAIALFLLAADSYRERRVNGVFLAAILFIVISGPVRILIAGTDTWHRFATWLIS